MTGPRTFTASAAPTDAAGGEVIDADGRTVMPGFIDAHRHLMAGAPDVWMAEEAQASMQAFLDAGFTTVLSAIDPLDQMFEFRRRIDAGEIAGPRLQISALVPLSTAPPPGGDGVDSVRVDYARTPTGRLRPRPSFRPSRPARWSARSPIAASTTSRP